MTKGNFLTLLVLCGLVVSSAASGDEKKPSLDKGRDQTASASDATPDPILVGAGDIASCDDLAGARATAKLIENIPGTVFATGDLAYPDGSDENFANCYGPT